MARGVWLPAVSLLLLAGLSGCPVTDDYFLETSQVNGQAGDPGTGQTMLASGGSMAGKGGATAGAGSTTAGTSELPAGGTPDMPTAGTASTGTCTPATERCNGHDDDCDDVIDELACNSMSAGTSGCSGFVLPSDPNHGYMLCNGTRDYDNAGDACAAQNMRLAWLETAAENGAVSKKVAALSNDAEVIFGATDSNEEGEWFWDGGAQFFRGQEDGVPVDGAYNAWTDGTPNDENQNEDCAVLMSATATWGDRGCSVKYAYLCEEAD